jgi:CheY-like chemotaxis protein
MRVALGRVAAEALGLEAPRAQHVSIGARCSCWLEQTRIPVAQFRSEPLTSHRPLVVLVVDDDRDTLEGISEVLVAQGHTSWLARSADEALVRLNAEPANPDAVLLDLCMPGMSAATFVARLKCSPSWATVPIVLMTAVDKDEIPSEVEVDAVLVKPFRLKRLLTTLEEAVRRQEAA